MHDDGTAGGPLRQVKVDNWGIFFLQRLQQFFNRSDHCDLTLQFAGNVKIKVHRLVLNACTEYFQALEKKLGKTKDNCLNMPSDLSPDVVLPIINFMYTGRLEFRDSLTKKLYYTAGRLNMPVLTKLLDAQGASEMNAEPSVPTVSLTPKPTTPSILSKSQSNSYNSPKKTIGKELPETLPGRKLPIWKKRRTPFLMSSYDDSAESAALAPENSVSIKEEPARPTRFEWPEDEETLKSYVPPFDSITYESAPLQLHSNQPAKPPPPAEEKKGTFEDLKSRYQPVKRLAPSTSEPDPKKSKMMDIQSVKEYLQEQEVRKQIVSNEEDGEECMQEGSMALGDVVEDDDDDEDDRDAESILPDNDDSVADTTSDNIHEAEASHSTPHQTKSILKQRYTEETTPGSKKVRFSLAANQEQTFSQVEEYATDMGESSGEIQTSPANHAKIISEVLKKYPHLVRDNKNIRLRIMKQGGCSNENETKNKKVSYVVLKAGDTGGKNRAPAKVIVKTGGRVEHISSLVATSQVVKPVSGAENTTGPWQCFSCGTNEEPVDFPTYYEYRRHLQDVHMEKIDARICEHCGHRASKRNLLLYHLYTKHNILPPRNCQFPKCDQCDYVALSESLLIKHRNNHSNAKDFVCKVCNASFKSNGALQGHMQTNLHSDPDKKKYECPYCRKPFVRNINLKAHVRTAHKDIDRKFEEDEQQEPTVATETVTYDPKKKKRRDILLLRGKDSNTAEGENNVGNNSASHPLEPSSEAEALSNVASGIAASLGLADQLAEVHEHQTVVQTMPGADGTVQTFIISAVPGQEYIVPEMLANAASGDQYQIATTGALADLVQYDASNLGAVVSSLAGASGQQTIVITTAPSGGQEHLKLISADGSTLDQVTLLTGQNLLVTNPDGTTSTASATEGYQAILQPNGVLTLQPVGTHVMQGEVHDGEAVTEETLVQQGYHVAQGTQILTLSHDEVQNQVEQSMALMNSDEIDTKPYTLQTSEQQQAEEVAQSVIESHEIQISQEMSQQIVEEQRHELSRMKSKKCEMPTKPQIIGTPIVMQRENIKAELITNVNMEEEMTEISQEELEEQQSVLNADNSSQEIDTLHDEEPDLEQVEASQESEMIVVESNEAHEQVLAAEEGEEAQLEAEPQDGIMDEMQTQQVSEESCVIEMEQEVEMNEQEIHQEQLEMEEIGHEEEHLEMEGDVIKEQDNMSAETDEQDQQEVISGNVEESVVTGEILSAEQGQEMLQANTLVEEVQYEQVEDDHGIIHDQMTEGDEEMDTMPLQVAETEVAQDGGGLLIEGDDEGALMIEADDAPEDENQGGVVLLPGEQVISDEHSQDMAADDEQGALMIEAEPQEAGLEANSTDEILQEQRSTEAV